MGMKCPKLISSKCRNYVEHGGELISSDCCFPGGLKGSPH